jgi:hypothetical protein
VEQQHSDKIIHKPKSREATGSSSIIYPRKKQIFSRKEYKLILSLIRYDLDVPYTNNVTTAF